MEEKEDAQLTAVVDSSRKSRAEEEKEVGVGDRMRRGVWGSWEDYYMGFTLACRKGVSIGSALGSS